MTILVAAATGLAGRHVVDHLLAAGRKVRALSRRPERAGLPAAVEVTGGDLTRPATLAAAFDGVTVLHLPTSGGADYDTLPTGFEIAALARRTGVRRVTLLWNGTPGPVEQAFAETGIAWTRLEPSDFMGNCLAWAAAIRTGEAIAAFLPETPDTVIDEADVGAAAASVLVHGGHDGQVHAMTGPQALSVHERARLLGEVLERELRVRALDEAAARARWQWQGYDPAVIDQLIAWQRQPPAQALVPTAAVERLLGRPGRGFAAWARANAAAFR